MINRQTTRNRNMCYKRIDKHLKRKTHLQETIHEYNLINSSDTEDGAKTPKSVIKKVIYSGGK